MSIAMPIFCVGIGWRSAETAEGLTLARDGTSEYSIVVPAEASSIPSERFAAEELSECLGRVTGVGSKVYISVPLNWAVLPPPDNKVEVHVSLKFTGPTYVPGSTDQDEVRLDRIVVASPPSSEDVE